MTVSLFAPEMETLPLIPGLPDLCQSMSLVPVRELSAMILRVVLLPVTVSALPDVATMFTPLKFKVTPLAETMIRLAVDVFPAAIPTVYDSPAAAKVSTPPLYVGAVPL